MKTAQQLTMTIKTGNDGHRVRRIGSGHRLGSGVLSVKPADLADFTLGTRFLGQHKPVGFAAVRLRRWHNPHAVRGCPRLEFRFGG